MKILMVLDQNFPPDIRVEHEILSLVSAGHEVHLASFTQKNAPAREDWNGAIIHRKPIGSFIKKTSVGCLKFPFYFNFWRPFISELHKEHNFDAIHVHDLPLAQIGAEFKEESGIHFVLDLHENWPALLNVSQHVQGTLGKLLSSEKQWRAYEKKMVAVADSIIVVVEESKARLVELGASPEKIRVVSNTPVLSELDALKQPRTATHDDLILFYGGVLTEHRGLQYIIKALGELKDLNIKCWMVGEGRYVPQLKALAEELGITEKLVFWGWKTLDELTKIMLEADVLLIPHKKSEHSDSTIPHKLFQYMLTGKPILSTNCNPLERIIGETESGFIYKFDDTNSIVEQINIIYNKWIEDSDISMNGKKFVLEKYNWSMDEQILMDIYRSHS